MDLLLGAATGGALSSLEATRTSVVSQGVGHRVHPRVDAATPRAEYVVCVLAPSLMRRVRSVGAEPMDAVLPTAIALVATVEMIAQQYTPLVVSIGTILIGCTVTVVRRGHPILAAGGVLASFVAAPFLGFDVSEPAAQPGRVLGQSLPRSRARGSGPWRTSTPRGKPRSRTRRSPPVHP